MRSSTSPAQRFLREPRHVVAVLRLLVFAGLAALGLSEPPVHTSLYWTVTIVYGITVVGYLLARNGEYGRRRVRCAIFLFDAMVVSALIVLRGRDVQGLVMAYFTLVFLAALLAGVGRPLLNAAVVAVLYHFVSARTLDPGEVFTFERIGQLAFFFVIAAFMGYVAREAQQQTEAAARVTPKARGTGALRESTARLRHARDRLGADERLRTLDLLSMGIAHELRGPLAAIRESVREGPTLLDDMERRVAGGEPTAELIVELRAVFEDTEHAVGKLRQTALGLNDLGCGGSGTVTRVAPREMLERAQRMLRNSAGSEMEVEVTCDATRDVRAEPARLVQVLLNLAANGIDAMQARSGGVLRLGAEDAGPDRVVFTVTDTGGGIPEEVCERMYDPFYTTKAPGRGTGLGLYVAREIVRAQRGSIDCRTELGEGTCFRVEFPAEAEPSEAAA